MNALAGSKSKLNFSLFLGSCKLSADNGSRKDQGDFTSSVAGRHLRWAYKFDVLHIGSRELQLSQIVHRILPIGWQRRAIYYLLFMIRKIFLLF